jgi:hypothetical protein
MTRLWVLLAALGAAAVLAWLLWPSPPPDGIRRMAGSDPWIIGAPDDPFAYDGSHSVPAAGSFALHWDDSDPAAEGRLEAEAEAVDGMPIRLLESGQSGSTVVVRSLALQLETIDAPVHGDTGRGGPELPRTHAALAGTGRFSLWLDGRLISDRLQGRWIVADALRRDDGAIRANGLIYSPLLRDKTGFADEGRLEGTLLLTSAEVDGPRAVVLHLVFRDVQGDAASEGNGAI